MTLIWWLLTWALKSLKNFHFNGLLLSKVENELQTFTGVMCHNSENWCKMFNRNWLVVSNLTWEIWRILTWTLEILKNFHFKWLLLNKVCNVWAKKVLMIYFSWHWRVMKNLRENWLVAWKMTWGIWQIFKEHSNVLKLGHWWDSFIQRRNYEHKIYRGVMYHGNE